MTEYATLSPSVQRAYDLLQEEAYGSGLIESDMIPAVNTLLDHGELARAIQAHMLCQVVYRQNQDGNSEADSMSCGLRVPPNPEEEAGFQAAHVADGVRYVILTPTK